MKQCIYKAELVSIGKHVFQPSTGFQIEKYICNNSDAVWEEDTEHADSQGSFCCWVWGPATCWQTGPGWDDPATDELTHSSSCSPPEDHTAALRRWSCPSLWPGPTHTVTCHLNYQSLQQRPALTACLWPFSKTRSNTNTNIFYHPSHVQACMFFYMFRYGELLPSYTLSHTHLPFQPFWWTLWPGLSFQLLCCQTGNKP